jgi:CDP-glycerol glycerophosphotransferase
MPGAAPHVIQDPDVSVILTTFNGAAYIERALDSLVRQTIGLERMQVLIVDDGSTDATPAILERYAAENPGFEVIRQSNWGGPAQPRNRALANVRGRYLFILDHDDSVADDALEAMVRVADENGTDVVVARMKGFGGRNTPRLMFSRTVPRTDVFSCSAYWLLNPMKLFRMSMVRALELKFDTEVPWGEDQSFVASAYIKGNGISILADKDYVNWVYRADGSNITTSVVSLAARMPVVDRMLDFVAANVPPGTDRDRLMRRHFLVEVLTSAFEGYRTEQDQALRNAAFERFHELADAYYTERIDADFPPNGRVLMRLVLEGRSDEFGEYLDALKQAGRPDVLLEDAHVFLKLPWFREPDKGLPDGLFDIAGSLRVECRTEPLVVDGSGVRLSARCRLGLLTDRVTAVDLVARSRARSAERSFHLGHTVVLDEQRPYVMVEDSIASARLPSRLPAGKYELFLRVAAGPTMRERRVRECAPPPAEVRGIRSRSHFGLARVATLVTTGPGNLSLNVVDEVTGLRRRLRRIRRLAGGIVRRLAGQTGDRSRAPV